MVWKPARTLAECHDIITRKGALHEVETRLIDGRLLKVYKNQPPSLRLFWLGCANQHKDNTYLVLGNNRITYGAALQQSLKLAGVFQAHYNVQKGDRVAICARNLPEYMIAFWACHVLGAVPVLVNAWLPSDPLIHCIVHTGCKIALFDHERAKRLAPEITKLQTQGVKASIVLDPPSHTSDLQGFELWQNVLSRDGPSPQEQLKKDPHIVPEDNAIIVFTSGTTGLPKGALSTHRQFLTTLLNGLVPGPRNQLRQGLEVTPPPDAAGKGLLLSVPFFHVTGLISLTMLATMGGMTVVLMRKWDAQEAVRLIKTENVKVAGGVPSMVSDLVSSDLPGEVLESLLFGGTAAPAQLPRNAMARFPNAGVSQGYGLTETNSAMTGISGPDYEARPDSVGVASPVNEVTIVKDGVVVPPGTVGELWIRGPNVIKCYWGDEAATAKALTKDGWFMTGDIAEMDSEGFIYIRDRLKDMIIRGGENIASVTVENALYMDERISQAAAVGVPDAKLGELVIAVVSTKPGYHGKVTESELIELARKKLPHFAVPIMIIVQSEQFELTPSAKILKAPLRSLAQNEWKRRQTTQRAKAKL